MGISSSTMMAASTGMSVGSSLLGGMQARDAAKYNAAVASQNAVLARQQGAVAGEQLQRDQQLKLGSMIAQYGASGVQTDTGSPMEILASSVRQMAFDRATLKYNYELKALGLDAEAGAQSARGANAMTSGILNAAGAGLKGYAQYIPLYGSDGSKAYSSTNSYDDGSMASILGLNN